MLLSSESRPATPRAADPLVAFAEIRALVLPVQRHYVNQLAPPVANIAGYHAGWLDEFGENLADPAGKALRPVLAVLAARAVGAPETTAVRAAVVAEMIHDFSLLHDDVIDGDRQRRHRPAAWVVFGTHAAILAGDALLAAAVRLTAETDRSADRRAVRRLLATVRELVRGQTLDVTFENRESVTPDEYSDMAQGKTAALLSCACSLGPLLAGAPDAVTGELAAFGFQLGMAFQFADDLLGLWGDPAATGKPVLADVHRRKKSAPVLAALNSGGTDARRLAELYERPGALSDDEATEAADLIERCGGKEWAEARAARHTASALTHLHRVEGEAEPLEELAALVRHITHRDR
ncbi:polyprenyl synthetase family protein [Amycolatopsis minnesotensis]|uniref:Family 2 encapsulin nanocompartment cargo protein polyprenyl transferase n=1 Tax=Amycolatopsis minnesotensis TaxID=337894 RepID=A0ABN2SY27_9PSEU